MNNSFKISRALDNFLMETGEFAISLNNSAIRYNLSNLSDILIQKEMSKAEIGSLIDFKSFKIINEELASLVPEIIRLPTVAHLSRYRRLEALIEESYSGLFLIYAKQAATSVKALYYYKVGNYDRAFADTLECIALNDSLIRNGVPSLTLRCIEQNRNLAKILLKQNNRDEAYKLIKGIFNYLLSGKVANLWGTEFSLANYNRLNIIFREYCTYDMLFITVSDLFALSILEGKNISIEWFPDMDFEVNNFDRQAIYNWMFLMKSAGDSDTDYVEALLYFFKEPMSRSYEILKLSLLKKLVILFDQASCSEKFNIKIDQYLKSSFMGEYNSFRYVSIFDHTCFGNNEALNK